MVRVCDVVTINAPLHPETENLFDAALIAKMKRVPISSIRRRGKICNRDAIANALKAVIWPDMPATCVSTTCAAGPSVADDALTME